MSLALGTRLGPYEVLTPIGAGASGTVYRAFDTHLRRQAAIKVLSNESADATARARFQREARAASSLNHPHILTVYDAGEVDGQQYLVTEFVDGGTLKDWAAADKRDWRQVIELLIGVADGLAAAHAAGITHRDIKPANILFSKSGYAKLSDFGLAKREEHITADDSTQTVLEGTRPGAIVGTVAYMAPEQARGRAVDSRSDIFSFGVVLYELLARKRPFTGSSHFEMLQSIVGDPPPPLPDQVPRPLCAVVDKMLAKDAGSRYQTMDAVVADLRKILRADGEPSPSSQTTLSRRTWIRAAAVITIAVLIFIGYRLWTQRPFRPSAEAVGWYQKGVAAMHSMTYESARRALEASVNAEPRFALAHASLARAYEELDYSDLARDSMLRALSLTGETRISNADLTRIRTYQFMVSHDYDRAAPLFEQLERQAAPAEKAAAALECGWVAQFREDTNAASAAYQRALSISPGYAAAKLRLGVIEGRRRNLNAALQAFTESEGLYTAASDIEGATESLLQKANLLIRSSRAQEAIPILEKALSVSNTLNNRSQQIRLELVQGVALRNLGDANRASELAQKAVDEAVAERMENVATSGLIDIGNAFLSRGDLAPAEQYYRRALDFARRNHGRRNEARALGQLGSIFEQRNQPDDARPFVEAALAFYKQGGYRREMVQTSALLGSIHDQRSEFEEAISILREAIPQAIQLQDRQVEALVRERLGDCLRDQGAWPEAQAEYETAVKLWGTAPQSITTRVTLAEIEASLGDNEKAEDTLAAADRLLASAPPVTLGRVKVAYLNSQLALAAKRARVIVSSPESESEVQSIRALIEIRSGRVKEGLESASNVIDRLEKSNLKARAASVRLETAAALFAAGRKEPAAPLIASALQFFEPRRICESAWRGHALLVKLSTNSADAESHRAAARASLDRLRASWPAENVEMYLNRPDIATLYTAARF
jgi:serine/threonine protein kinase/lipopolysaccharide biosynthesis regulator YciM